MTKKIIIFSTVFLFLISGTVYSQKGKDQKKLWASDYNYEAQCLGTGVEGTKLIKVWGYAKKEEDAKIVAKKRAIAACIFKGVSGVDKIDPIITKHGVAEQHAAYFDKFFETGGKYLGFVSISNDATGKDKMKLKKGYKVGLTVSVMYDALRKELEGEGIVDKLGGAIGKAKKPSIMIVPSQSYCNNKGFTQKWDNQGETVVVPDYGKLMLNDQEMKLVLRKIEGMMIDRGFPLKNLEAQLKKLNKDGAKIAMLQSKESGLSIAESPIDILNRTAKADIIMDLDFKVNKKGPKVYITFNLGGIDAYTSKSIATAVGTGEPSYTAPSDLLLEEAVLKHIDNFNTQLQGHFDDMAENGREVTVQIKVWDGADVDLETEYDYKGRSGELRQIINMWMSQNTVNKQFNRTAGTENMTTYEDVRIPLEIEDEWTGGMTALDTEAFVQQLRGFLKKNFQITSKVLPNGLGESWLIIGEK